MRSQQEAARKREVRPIISKKRENVCGAAMHVVEHQHILQMLPSEHLQYLCTQFRLKQVIGVIVACSMKDAYFSDELLKIPNYILTVGKEFGGVSPASVLFLIDMMRVSMKEVYGSCVVSERAIWQSYRRLCGRPFMQKLQEHEAQDIKTMLCFFCENMLCVRNRLRYQKGFASYLCRMALEAEQVKAVMKRKGLEGLKHMLHFTGLTLYELMVITDSEDLFLWRDDVEKMDYLQLDKIFMAEDGQHELQTFMRGAEAHGTVDAWGHDGPDTMTNAMALFSTIVEYRGQRSSNVLWNTEYSELVF